MEEWQDLGLPQIQARDEPIGKGSLCQEEDDGPGGGEITECSVPDLPEGIWCHIHSLMPMRDAARAACVSRAFLRLWRCRPNLTFGMKTLGMKRILCEKEEMAKKFSSNVDNILKNHSCIGLKSLKIFLYSYNAEACNVHSWLQTAITPGIEELSVLFSEEWGTYYKFPWSLLANGSGNSILSLTLGLCAFSPTVGLGLKSMTRLDLYDVCITEDQLGCLLHNSFALQWMQLSQCNELICLKVPLLLQQLRYLEVYSCTKLQVVESEAPNLSNFQFIGHHQIQISLGAALQLKELYMSCSGAVCYARADLPSSLPNVEALSLSSRNEVFHFKMEHESIVGDTSHLREMQGHRHNNLKTVTIIGFSSARTLVELTCHIIENTTSLEYLTLDTTRGHPLANCSSNKSGKCELMGTDRLVEACKGLSAIRTYVEPKVPSRVNLTVVEPCRRCHESEL